MSRMSSRPIIVTSNEMVEELRDKNSITHYSTPKFSTLTDSQISTLRFIRHIWKEGDKYFKLSAKYYDDSTFWWIIARFNGKPTEAHLSIGDEVLIPVPFERIVSYYRE